MEEKSDKSSKRKTREQLTRLILALVVFFIIIIIFVLWASWPLLTGTTVILATRPVDPFDLLRGQYMTIGYEIASIPSLSEINEGDVVYVSIKEDINGTWRYDSVSLIKPEKGVFIKGNVISTWNGLQIQYGIEQFFFEMNAMIPTSGIEVEVKIDSNGNARVVQLLENKKPVNITYKSVKLTS